MFCFIRAFIGSVHDVCLCVDVCFCECARVELVRCFPISLWPGQFDTFLVNNHSNNSGHISCFVAEKNFVCLFVCYSSFVVVWTILVVVSRWHCRRLSRRNPQFLSFALLVHSLLHCVRLCMLFSSN